MPDNDKDVEQLVREALEILLALGVPLDGLSKRRQQKMAKAFMAVAGIKPGISWANTKSNDDQHRLLSRQIIRYMNQYLGENIADSSYDDIRRKDLVLPVEAGIVLKSAANPNANTNDGTRPYALNPEVANQIRLFGTPEWGPSLAAYLGNRTTLAQQLRRERDMARIPIKIKHGGELRFSPGPHNQLQKKIIEEFLPNFGFGAEVFYVGDTTDKFLYLDENRLQQLGFSQIANEKLPDIVAYSENKNWLFLIEAVHSANPIDELRRKALLKMAEGCRTDVVLVTAFPDRKTFKQHAKDIAWETEVWIADTPDHLIHFNGDKFLGPHNA